MARPLQLFADEHGHHAFVDDPEAIEKWRAAGYRPFAELTPKARRLIAERAGIADLDAVEAELFDRRQGAPPAAMPESELRRLVVALWPHFSEKISDLVRAEIRKATREAGWPAKDAKPGKGDQP